MPRDGIGEWMTGFASRPTPDQVAAALRGVAAAGTLRRGGAGPAVVFFGQVLRRYPQRTAEWAAVLDALPEPDQAVLWAAVHAAATDAGRVELARRAAGTGPVAAVCRELLGRPVPDLLRPAAVTPAAVDAWWAAYFATGHAAYVEAVIAVAATPEGTTVDPARAAARWSLVVLRRQDPHVRQVLDDFLARRATPQQAAALADVAPRPATTRAVD